MNHTLTPLTVVFSAKALFNLDAAHEVYATQGLEAYNAYQIAHEMEILEPGPGFSLVRSLSQLLHPQNKTSLVHCVLLSQADPQSVLRILNSAQHYGINLTRAAFTGGHSQVSYLKAYGSDLFLGTNAEDVQSAINQGFAAAMLYPHVHTPDSDGTIRIAFDGDCVLFGPESEIANQGGWEQFMAFERTNASTPMLPGPFQPFLAKLCQIQQLFPRESNPIRTALITARSVPAHIRPVLTFRHWGLHVNEAHFLAGANKSDILSAFQPHIFFDDQKKYCDSASAIVPTGRVPLGPHA